MTKSKSKAAQDIYEACVKVRTVHKAAALMSKYEFFNYEQFNLSGWQQALSDICEQYKVKEDVILQITELSRNFKTQ